MNKDTYEAMRQLPEAEDFITIDRLQEYGISVKKFKKRVRKLAKKYRRSVKFKYQYGLDEGVRVMWKPGPPVIGDIWQRISDGRRVIVMEISGPYAYNKYFMVHWAHATNPTVCISAPRQEFFMKHYRLLEDG